jgi:transposase, IS30 family
MTWAKATSAKHANSVIAQLRQAGLALRAIGRLVGYAASTISRELRHNASAQGYCARRAQARATQRRQCASAQPHLGQALWDQVHALMLLTQAAPKQVALVLPVSAQAVYNWLYRAIAAGDDYLVACLRQGCGVPR